MEILLVLLVVGLATYFLFFRRGKQPSIPESSGRADVGSQRRQTPKSAPNELDPAEAEAPDGEPSSVEEPSASGEVVRQRPRSEPERPAPADASDADASDADAAAEAELSTAAAPSQPPPADTGRAATVTQGPDVATLRRGLARSRESGGVFGRLKALFTRERDIDASIAEDIEEILLTSDVGAATTTNILSNLRESLSKGELGDSDAVWKALREQALRMLGPEERASGLVARATPTVVLLVGVNGAGKTTTIGKLAKQLHASGKQCLLAAGDTFRAAAVQQLIIWGDRVGCEVVHGKDGADPASVLFDAIRRGQELGVDFILADTAGRLHTKTNLMVEMQKIARTANKALSGAPHETFLVIDSTNGQNALAQAREFKEALDISGIVLTKLDGTAKGGVVLGISDSLSLPVRYVGMGEGPDDLHEFAPQRFVDALLGDERAA